MSTTRSLHNAVKIADLGLVRELIAGGADVNSKDHLGHTPLLSLVEAPECELGECSDKLRAAIARLLIERGADVNARAGYANYYTAFHWALIRNRTELARVLIESGSDTNAAGANGEIPIAVAVRRGQAEIVNLLIVRGANVNAITDDSNHEYQVFIPLLILAVKAGNVDIVKMLVKAGADVNCEDPDDGIFAVDLAAHKQNTELVDFFVKSGAKLTYKRAISDLSDVDTSDFIGM